MAMKSRIANVPEVSAVPAHDFAPDSQENHSVAAPSVGTYGLVVTGVDTISKEGKNVQNQGMIAASFKVLIVQTHRKQWLTNHLLAALFLCEIASIAASHSQL